jgi:hypothetical protein
MKKPPVSPIEHAYRTRPAPEPRVSVLVRLPHGDGFFYGLSAGDEVVGGGFAACRSSSASRGGTSSLARDQPRFGPSQRSASSTLSPIRRA